jgi:DNA-binding ferritin-like protein (Dps family)
MSTMPAVFSKMIVEKRRWRQYKARTRQLPENYRTGEHTGNEKRTVR